MKFIFFIFIVIFIVAITFLPIVGAYIGLLQVMKDDNNKWQKENKDAYLIFNGR